jgi:hypothetical protein
MTTEELLKARYKVIAGYPDSHYTIGTILDRNWCRYENDDEETGKIIWQLSDFPHLFKKLEWWEERKPEEMPEYLKWDYNPKTDNEDVKGLVSRVTRWLEGNHAVVVDKVTTISTICWLPATAAEYEDYINKKNNDAESKI